MEKKRIMAALLGGALTMMSVVAFAAEPAAKAEEAVKAAPAAAAEWKEATVRGAITGHEAGTIYKLTDEEGKVVRADLGKYGGKMLNKVAFTATGTMKTDEKGEYLKVKHVEYKDPLAAIQVNRSNPLSKQMQARLRKKSGVERDAAYFHKGINSTYAN